MDIVYHNINEANMSVILINMGLYIKQEVERTELQKRVAQGLDDKAKKARELSEGPDLVEDSAYIKGTEKTTSFAWIWILIIVIVVGVTIWLVATGLAHDKLLGV